MSFVVVLCGMHFFRLHLSMFYVTCVCMCFFFLFFFVFVAFSWHLQLYIFVFGSSIIIHHGIIQRIRPFVEQGLETRM